MSLVSSGKDPKWFPVPGGAAFHDWKSGLFPALKTVFSGCMFEDLIAGGRSGLSRFYVEKFSSTTNLRKNRRVVDQSAIAQILVAADSLRASDSNYSDEMKELEDDVSSAHLDDCAQNTVYAAGFKIRVDSMVTRRIYDRGDALRKEMLRRGGDSDTAQFYLQVLLCDSIVPIIGSQTLLRLGQTTVYNKLWFTLAPLLMATGQFNYQKLVVMHMYVLALLPDAVVSDLLLGEFSRLTWMSGGLS